MPVMVADTAWSGDSNANATRDTCWGDARFRIKVRIRGHQPGYRPGALLPPSFRPGAGPMSLTRKQLVRLPSPSPRSACCRLAATTRGTSGDGSPTSSSSSSASATAEAAPAGQRGQRRGSGPGRGRRGSGAGRRGRRSGSRRRRSRPGRLGGNPSADCSAGALETISQQSRTRVGRLRGRHHSCSRRDGCRRRWGRLALAQRDRHSRRSLPSWPPQERPWWPASTSGGVNHAHPCRDRGLRLTGPLTSGTAEQGGFGSGRGRSRGEAHERASAQVAGALLTSR